MKTTLIRIHNQRKRYYTLELFADLLGGYLLIRTYGGCVRAKPTRIISQSFESYCNAYSAWEKIMKEKIKRGYIPKNKESP
ncbi:MAG: WGR domain-containing protein [Sulfuricurvum sp.]|nr:WGR domain-containing protein [Sulfuricurvum sp.]